MRRLRHAIELLAVPTLALGLVIALLPDHAALGVHVWLLTVLALLALVFLGATRRAYPQTPSPFSASLVRPTVVTARPAGLLRMERELSMAGSAAFDVHHRLRPVLVELAAGLLTSRRGIDLRSDPELAHAALGDDAWALVRPERQPPPDRDGPGLPVSELDRVVSALEAL